MLDPVFEEHRRTLERIAYRMLGSLAEAQDVVQETHLRWTRVDASQIASPRAWLTTVCTRLAINQLNLARARRESYVGPWLPEPIVEAFDGAGPGERQEAISLALLVALERLSPLERAALLLHDVFDYDFEAIAVILERSPEACRKLASRARVAARDGRPRFKADPTAHQAVVQAFAEALETGDLERLKALLTHDAILVADGGGRVKTSAPLAGGDVIAAFLAAVIADLRRSQGAVAAQVCWVNGEPGVALHEGDRLTTVYGLEVDGERIHALWIQRNPAKLAAMA